jgi:hypothetical protein
MGREGEEGEGEGHAEGEGHEDHHDESRVDEDGRGSATGVKEER